MKKILMIMKDFLNGKISSINFSNKFENFFIDNEKDIKKISKKKHIILEELKNDIAYFEPNEALLYGDVNYFDENELREKVQNALEKLNSEKRG